MAPDDGTGTGTSTSTASAAGVGTGSDPFAPGGAVTGDGSGLGNKTGADVAASGNGASASGLTSGAVGGGGAAITTFDDLVADFTGVKSTLADIGSRLDKLEARVGAVEAKPDNAPAGTDFVDRIERLEIVVPLFPREFAEFDAARLASKAE